MGRTLLLREDGLEMPGAECLSFAERYRAAGLTDSYPSRCQKGLNVDADSMSSSDFFLFVTNIGLGL